MGENHNFCIYSYRGSYVSKKKSSLSALNDCDSVLFIVVFPIVMDLIIKAKHCLIFLILNSHFSYLLSTKHVMDVTIDYLPCTEYVKLHPQVFWHYALLGSVILTISTFFTGTVFITISGFQIIAELK